MFSCEVCQVEYMSVSGLNKHFRTKHKDVVKTKKPVKKNVHYCNDCDQSFNLKKKLTIHVQSHFQFNLQRNSNILCSFENCSKSFSTLNRLILHLQSTHDVAIESTLSKFNTIDGILFIIFIVNIN